MKRREKRSILIALGLLFLAIGIAVFFFVENNKTKIEIPNEPTIVPSPTVDNPEPIKPPSKPLPEPEPIEEEEKQYYIHTIKTDNTQTELDDLVGEENVKAVLQTNRIDIENIKMGTELVIPTTLNISNRSPFPLEIPDATDITKLLIINQRVQAFGAYEYGKLVRWGPTSTGKESTKTPNGLFSTNWKGVEVKSSFDDEWILKYNFNIDNFEGIGFHQYSMPGYPASHSCVRLLIKDAMWLYEWADQWILNDNERKRLAHGTPVIIFGEYEYEITAPWKLLPVDPEATDISEEELSGIILDNKETILERQNERETLLNSAAE